MILAALWAKTREWVYMLGAALLVLVGAYAMGGRAVRKSMEHERVAQALRARRVRDEVVSEYDAMDDSAVRDRARKRMRDSAR